MSKHTTRAVVAPQATARGTSKPTTTTTTTTTRTRNTATTRRTSRTAVRISRANSHATENSPSTIQPSPRPKDVNESKLQSLHETTTLLDQIWRRNRNQHRTQHWWKDLGLLRRNLKRLTGLLENVLDSKGGIGTKTGHRSKESEANGHDTKPRTQIQTLSEAQQTRLRLSRLTTLEFQIHTLETWLREILLPRCWVGFSQVLAERTWAGIGLVLLGIVGEVGSIVGVPTAEGKRVGRIKDMGDYMDDENTTRGDERVRGIRQSFNVDVIDDMMIGADDGDDMGEIVPRRATDIEPNTTVEPDTVQETDTGGDRGGDSTFAGFDDTDKREAKRRAAEYQGENSRMDDVKSNEDAQQHTARSLARERASSDKGQKKRPRPAKNPHGDEKQKKIKSKGRKGDNVIDDLFAGLI